MKRVRIGAGLGALAVVALSILFPPAAMFSGPPTADAGLLARLFPDVPAVWIVVRLAGLAVGAWVLTGAFERPRLRNWEPVVRDGKDPTDAARGSWLLNCCAVYAGALVLAAIWVDGFDRLEQWLLVGAVALPSVVVWFVERPTHRRFDRPMAFSVAAVAAVWLATWAPWAWRSPWIANFGDALGQLEALNASLRPDFNLWTDTLRPACTTLELLFYGAGSLDSLGITPTPAFVQGVNLFWTLMAGVVVGFAAGRIVGRQAAPVATAVVLFSPLGAMASLCPVLIFFGPLMTGSVLVLLDAVHVRRSSAALVALGAVAGLAGTSPSTAVPAVAMMIFGCASALRGSRIPAAAAVTAALTFLAVMTPTIMAYHQAVQAFGYYSGGFGQWSAIEAVMLGQVAPETARYQMLAGAAGLLDAPLGALLSPFATPRTAIRFWGDVLFDPLSVCLVAVGIAVCIRSRSRTAWAVLLLLGLCVGTGSLSTYDRTSIVRMLGVPVPVALLVAIGFVWIQARIEAALPTKPNTSLRNPSVETEISGETLAEGRSAGTVAPTAGLICAGLIAISGSTLSMVVNPSILGQSALGLAMEATKGSGPFEKSFVIPQGDDPIGARVFAAGVPAEPMPVVAVGTQAYDPNASALGDGAVLFWGPGTEDDLHLAARVCARRPRTQLMTVTDRAGLSWLMVAVPPHDDWRPPIPEGRWSMVDCPASESTGLSPNSDLPNEASPTEEFSTEGLPTEESRERMAIREAKIQLGRGNSSAAIELLRAAAHLSFARLEIFDLLARLLLKHGTTRSDRTEALFWAGRAADASGWCSKDAVRTLAAVHEASGDGVSVRETRERARHEQLAECRSLRHDHPVHRRFPHSEGPAPTGG